MQSCLQQSTFTVLRVTHRQVLWLPPQSVPMFLPIMRGTLNLPAVRDPEVLERLDPNGLLSLCLRYQQHIALCSEVVASEQVQLGHKVRDVSGCDLMSRYLES